MKFPNLLPRSRKFEDLLEQLSGKACDSAAALKTYAASRGDAACIEAQESIKRLRLEAKVISMQITRELSRTYITPFDREDIQDFAAHLYRIPKLIEKIRERMDLHGMTGERRDFSPQIDLIVREAEVMQDLVQALLRNRDFAQIKGKVSILHDLEHRGDEVLNDLMVKLFAETQDPRDLILRKDIYDMLENVIDRFRDVASVALQIVLKYS